VLNKLPRYRESLAALAVWYPNEPIVAAQSLIHLLMNLVFSFVSDRG
jgi:hypothetical protein